MSIFSTFKDLMMEHAGARNIVGIKFPLKKTSAVFNGYTKGDFIVVGGRKTSGRSSFMLYNYIIHPMINRMDLKKKGTNTDLKLIYINSRKSFRSTIEKMIVNYTSTKNKGNKIGVPSLYGYDGSSFKISETASKKIISSSMDVFDAYLKKGFLTVSSSKKSILELDELIKRSMEEYGEFNDTETEFTYKEEHKNVLPIIVVDDASNIVGDNNSPSIRNDNAYKLAIKLKDLAKMLNAVVVLGVPSASVYSKGAYHRSSIDEINPYHLFADRSIILHNPFETNDPKVLGYEIDNFVNRKTGVCYFRMGYIASNYMGPSGIFIPYFMYPENGYIEELPKADNMLMLEDFYEKVDSN